MRDYLIREGRKRLTEWLPEAKKEAEANTTTTGHMSSLGETTIQYARFDNLDALVIHEAPTGGWHADVLFKETPHGVPNVMGTPVGHPCGTRAEALEAGKSILCLVVAECIKNEASGPPTASPVFLYRGLTLRLASELLEVLGSYETTDHANHAILRFTETEKEIFPNGFSEEAMAKISHDDMLKIATVAHMAALTGVFAYPPRTPVPPPSDTKH
jgi:hypothetical protein